MSTLIKISPTLNEAKMLVRVTKKLQLINDAIYLKTEAELIEIGKMLGGWIKSINEALFKNPPR